MKALSFVLRPIHDHGPECGCVFMDGKVDRTGTSKISRAFELNIVRRYQRLRSLIWQSIVTQDAFGLGKAKPIYADEVARAGQFQFGRSTDKVQGFMRWLSDQQKQQILDIQVGTPLENAGEDAWTNLYISNAYQKGIIDAGTKMRAAGASVAGSWIENAMTRPIHADRVGLIYTRTFNELKGINNAMDQKISRVLANGIANGDNPMTMARAITAEVDSVGIVRARTLARTETINAHAAATLNGFEEAGIDGVEVEAEWLTAADACPLCEDASKEGPFTISEARSLIPLHPNCRCAWAPVVKNGTGIELR